VAADVHCQCEVIGRGVEIAALELVLVGEGDGMDQEIEFAPFLLDRGESGVDAGRVGHVAGVDHLLAADRLGQRPHALFQRLALESAGELGAAVVADLGDGPGDRAFVGHAHDQALFSGHQLCSCCHALFYRGLGAGTRCRWWKAFCPCILWPMIREKADPLNLFADWYSEAEKSEPNDPSAMSLATVGPDGTPSVRMVLLKGFDASGFVFYTNHESRKGLHLVAHS